MQRRIVDKTARHALQTNVSYLGIEPFPSLEINQFVACFVHAVFKANYIAFGVYSMWKENHRSKFRHSIERHRLRFAFILIFLAWENCVRFYRTVWWLPLANQMMQRKRTASAIEKEIIWYFKSKNIVLFVHCFLLDCRTTATKNPTCHTAMASTTKGEFFDNLFLSKGMKTPKPRGDESGCMHFKCLQSAW